MSLPNGEQRLELRDTKGTTLGFFLSERELQEQAVERKGLLEEITRLQVRIADLTREKDELRKQVDNHERILEVWERDGVAPMTRKELEHQRQHGVPFEAVIAEIEGMVRSHSGGA